MEPIPENLSMSIRTIAIEDGNRGNHSSKGCLNKDAPNSLKSMTSAFKRVPSGKKDTREARCISCTEFPIGQDLGEIQESRKGATHGLLEENHIRSNRAKK